MKSYKNIETYPTINLHLNLTGKVNKIIINLKSFDQLSLKRFVNYLKASEDLVTLKSNIIYLPSKSKKLVLFRSPHVQKKSKAKYELVEYSAIYQIDLSCDIPNKFLNSIDKIMRNTPDHVFLSYTYVYNH